MRRDYGSRLFELVDAPINRTTLIDFYASTVEALSRWEPRIRVDRVSVDAVKAGQITMTLQATLVESGEPVTLDGIVV